MIVRTLTGVVKDGVIVPDVPLRDGDYVEITVPTAPREIAMRVRCRKPDEMQTEQRVIAGVPVELGPDVPDLLRHHNAEDAFTRLIEFAKTTFPELVRLKTWVREYELDAGHFVIVCQGFLPQDHPKALFGRQRRSFSNGEAAVSQGLPRLFTCHFQPIAQE